MKKSKSSPVRKKSYKNGVYYPLYNGFKPYRVVIKGKSVIVYYICDDDYKIKFNEIIHMNNITRVFKGWNSLLLKIGKQNKYLQIGGNGLGHIYIYETPQPITKYESPDAGNSSPGPGAWSKDYAYAMGGINFSYYFPKNSIPHGSIPHDPYNYHIAIGVRNAKYLPVHLLWDPDL